MDYEKTVAKTRQILKDRLTDRSVPDELVGLDEQYTELLNYMNRTVSLGESNTCILIGPSGCGKTALVKKAIQSLNETYNNDFYCVNLNGLLHTSDQFVRYQIGLQLGQQIKGFRSDGDVFNLLKSGTSNTKPIFIIIYNFDAFAKNCSQLFVYNIFNIATSKNCPISVIGITRKANVFNELAQNILSRNSYCHIDIDRPCNFESFAEIIRNCLMINEAIFDDIEYSQEFNEKIEELFDYESFYNLINQTFNYSTDFIRSFYKICFDAVCKLTIDSPFLLPEDFSMSTLQDCGNIDTVLKGLTQNQLWLLLAINSLDLRFQTKTFNFAMVYEEYKNYMKSYARESGSTYRMKICKEHVALAEFEFLESRKILQCVDENKFQQKQYKMMRLLLLPEQIIDAINDNEKCPTMMKEWVNRVFTL
ncbi:origin recognition complex subunit 4 C-terminus-domain-containing protein [Gigaspora rosea]|uniref:Origin recognition complex subunit 4 n=1 Tax=Gigaspora rosea TaxID=44941 RepID=A0A397UR42_9GLOM|nr:origin recognition complex subunit 4 C-terminus-domain-containing protein [Gigaspora rosea]